MRIDNTQATMSRCGRVYPVVHMDIDRKITCKACGKPMVVSVRSDAVERMAEIVKGITVSQVATTEGKQGMGPGSK